MKDNRSQHLTRLPATVPAALEDNSNTTWHEFQSPHTTQERQFEPTRPLTMPVPLLPAEPAKTVALRRVTLDDALAVARGRNRVCPMPPEWAALFALMRELAPPRTVPPFPIDAAAWSVVPAMQKRMRLREQLEWAERYEMLDATLCYLASLSEEAWLHF